MDSSQPSVKPSSRRGRRQFSRFFLMAMATIMVGGFTSDSMDQLKKLLLQGSDSNNDSGTAGKPNYCFGGMNPIVMYTCDSGVLDVDCGSGNGCLSTMLDGCLASTNNANAYEKCVKGVTTKCTSALRFDEQGSIMACAASMYSSIPSADMIMAQLHPAK